MRLDVGGDAGAAGAEQRVHLVEEHDDRVALFALLARALEDQADLALGLADVLVEELGALDVEEVRAGRRVAGLLGDALGERVRDRLGDERLAATRRAVQQDALRRLELVLLEEVAVEVRELDRVLDHLDLLVEAADVVVGDVGDLFEHELLDLGPGQLLEQQARAALHQQVVAGVQLLAEQALGELAHALLVGAADDERARAVFEELLERDDLARRPRAAGEHDVERLVEHDLLAALRSSSAFELGVQRDAHLAAGGEDVGGAVVVGAEERAVGRRRHRELLDLFAERGDVLARLTQRGGELLVLGDGLGELALGLEQALFEGADALRGVLQPAAEDDDLFFEALDRLLELGDLPFVLGQPALVLRGHDWAPPRSSRTLVLRSGCSSAHPIP